MRHSSVISGAAGWREWTIEVHCTTSSCLCVVRSGRRRDMYMCCSKCFRRARIVCGTQRVGQRTPSHALSDRPSPGLSAEAPFRLPHPPSHGRLRRLSLSSLRWTLRRTHTAHCVWMCSTWRHWRRVRRANHHSASPCSPRARSTYRRLVIMPQHEPPVQRLVGLAAGASRSTASTLRTAPQVDLIVRASKNVLRGISLTPCRPLVRSRRRRRRHHRRA
mmetsp:Transcript_47134/g.123688  ORF Transcript_47134/g.123688 Transcript_47134/m.123688 type:complete len:219 (+) Transcript_47134:302-958(+)